MHCNEANTNKVWCLSCDPDIETTRWTSRSKDIDDCIKKFQLRACAYDDAIEWIPYDKLINTEKIGEGGFGSVYSAKWLDGIRKIEEIKINRDDNIDDNRDDDGDRDEDDNNYLYKRSREASSIVALKTLSGSLKEVS